MHSLVNCSVLSEDLATQTPGLFLKKNRNQSHFEAILVFFEYKLQFRKYVLISITDNAS